MYYEIFAKLGQNYFVYYVIPRFIMYIIILLILILIIKKLDVICYLFTL